MIIAAPFSATIIVGGVGVAGRHVREDRRIHDPQPVEAMHPQAVVDDAGAGVGPHRARPAEMVDRPRLLAEILQATPRAGAARGPGVTSSTVISASAGEAVARWRTSSAALDDLVESFCVDSSWCGSGALLHAVRRDLDRPRLVGRTG